tara:strand:+ start:1993 stop:2970 length:978 start_codon:yes stop_codon:yes gene_type:complete
MIFLQYKEKKMSEENAKVIEEVEVDEGEVVEIEPVEEEKPKTQIPMESVDKEAEEKIEDVSDAPEAKQEEELEDYSKSVQKRINNLTRKLREAERGQESAYEYAKRTAAENEHLKAKSSNLDRSYLMEAENRLKSQKQQAMSALKSAHEVQDFEKVAKAQEVLAKIAVEENKVSTSKMAIEQQVQQQPVRMNGQAQQNVQQVPQYQAPPKLDAKQEKWVENNSWFGEDEIMTLAAFSIDQKLVQEGYDASSDEYYSEVDKRLRTEFPHKFEESSAKTKPQQKVASAGRVAGNTSSKRQVKLSPAEVQMAKRLNVPLTEYAKYVKR